MLSRRSIIAGLIAAPAIVKASSLMALAPTEIIKPPRILTPPVRIVWPRAFVQGDLATFDSSKYYVCIRTGFGGAAEFMEVRACRG